jgi:hypothetical protein
VYFSPGDSSVVILAPKREGKGLKIPPTSSSSTKKQVTRKNPDPKPVAAVSDPEKLLRKPKNTPGQSSLSKGKFSSTSTQGQSSKTVKLTPIEEVIPESETKSIVEPATVSFPSTISELNLNQWKLFVELIEEEQTNTLSVAEALRDFPKILKVNQIHSHHHLNPFLLKRINHIIIPLKILFFWNLQPTLVQKRNL